LEEALRSSRLDVMNVETPILRGFIRSRDRVHGPTVFAQVVHHVADANGEGMGLRREPVRDAEEPF
jgi:hypothetical protein